MNDKSISEILDLVFRAVALAMGVVVIVLSALGTLEVKASISILGMGLASLALAAFLHTEQK